MPSVDWPELEVIAMHGWAGQSTNWNPWQRAVEPLEWPWQAPERGYGTLAPRSCQWGAGRRRVVIGHSLGPHLLPASLLAAADGVVLLASFGRFVPTDREGRRLRMALERMAAPLSQSTGPPSPPVTPGPEPEAQPEQREAAVAAGAQAMLRAFLAEAAAPDPVNLMPPGPADQPPGAESRQRLLRDLELLGRTTGLPAGFPEGAKLLIVEAEQDRIVPPRSRAALREALPSAEVISMAGAGHALLQAPVIPAVLEWLAGAFPVGA